MDSPYGKSVKLDNASLTHESKAVKKTKSFREDVKGFIKRRASSNQPMSPHNVKKERIGRNLAHHTSLMDGDLTPAKKLLDENKLKLRVAMDNVHRSLRFISEVVDKHKLQILPGSATVVLETIIEMFNLVNNLKPLADSTVLTSRQCLVFQSLAQFIHWTDDMLLSKFETFDKASAKEVIATLSESLKQLSQFAEEKLDNQTRFTPQLSPITSPSSNGIDGSNAIKRYSYPELPLTPREKEILDTSPLSSDTPQTHKSQSSDNIFMTSRATDESPVLTPPPKPPLPVERRVSTRIGIKVSKSASFEGILNEEDMPPPIPDKNRSSHNSQYDNLTSIKVNHCSLSSDYVSHVSSLNQTKQSFITSVRSGRQSLNSITSNHSPFNRHSGGSVFSDPFDMSPLRRIGQSPLSSSPLSHSPCSSTSSGLNTSHDDADGMLFNHKFISPFSTRTAGLNGKSPSCITAFNGKSPETDVMRSPPVVVSNFPKQSVYDTMISPTARLNQLMNRMNKLELAHAELIPLLPDKQRPRLHSTYDNVEPHVSPQPDDMMVQSRITYQAAFGSGAITQHRAFSSTETFSCESHLGMDSSGHYPPPLPPKTRHIQEYMKTIGSYTQPMGHDYMSRHSLNFYGHQWHQHHTDLFHPRSNTVSIMSDLSSTGSDVYSTSSGSTDGPPSPWRQLKDQESGSSGSNSSGIIELPINFELREKASSLIETPVSVEYTNDGTLKRSSAPITLDDPRPVCASPHSQKDTDSDFAEINILDDVDVSDQLIISKKTSDDHTIRGGSVDALIVHATTAGKNDLAHDTVDAEDFLYQEAFLTTYRTFISPHELLTKLLYRFHRFHEGNDSKKHLARNTFSLLVRVIDELAPPELTDDMAQCLMNLEYELVSQGTLILARVLRNKLIEKMEQRRSLPQSMPSLPSLPVDTSLPDVMQYKAQEIAEQMTLMDAKLFQTIEIPEVLLWAKEQSEELSPNLTKFTIHFNNMSYWCRTKILNQEEPKDREKYLVKCIKILRHLRKFNNFNSYLAILSAVDSAHIRRLDFHKTNLDALKELSQLIDSSSSFRAYRRAVADSEPPCIPYIGLILQDLTFIHIGNADKFDDGSANFAKRWQQFHILDNMRRFKKCNYDFKRNEKLQQAFGNFEDYHSEEVLWQISEQIKPRATPKQKDSKKSSS